MAERVSLEAPSIFACSAINQLVARRFTSCDFSIRFSSILASSSAPAFAAAWADFIEDSTCLPTFANTPSNSLERDFKDPVNPCIACLIWLTGVLLISAIAARTCARDDRPSTTTLGFITTLSWSVISWS